MQKRRALVFLVLGVANFLQGSDKKDKRCFLMEHYNAGGYIAPVGMIRALHPHCTVNDTIPNRPSVAQKPKPAKPVVVPSKNNKSRESKKSSPSREAVSQLFHIILSKLKSNLSNPTGIRFIHGIPYFKSNL